MSIYSFLKDDHQKIKDLMNSIESIGPEEQELKEQKFNDLKRLLISHSKAEERIFYRPLEKFKETKDEVEHGKEEHQEAEMLLDELTDEELKGSAWQQKFIKLKEAVEHHIKEEEEEVFNDAHKVLDGQTEEVMEEKMAIAEKKELNNRGIEERHCAS